MPFEWSNENTIKFLELLEGEKVIWDVSDKNHKANHKVHAAWKRISEALENTPIVKLKSKKKSLMATFRPLLKKHKRSIQSGTCADDIFQPIWFAYDVMERFLGPTLTVEETMDTEEQPLQNDSTSNDGDTMPRRPSQQAEMESSRKGPNTVIKINARKRNIDHVINEADKNINNSFATQSRVLERTIIEEDDCDIYAKLLAKKLRRYPERMRYMLMYKIDGLLLDNPYPDERPSSAST
ncbi:alcohol dehydrogenase transcription factor myb/sant-like [Holotrichia oblita]|uniref:Alcohol dehydrogenase transcription factor myb/sant-like n=1 Tax=Holotrichia oblita TaxID=644536 RepID=A0ACB9SWQ2_HOLOL|nr:alcohol dehydrogenase transcription factor myb/sant-like [Holotrichia oblita]